MRTTWEMIREHRYSQAYLRAAPILFVVTLALMVGTVVYSLQQRATFDEKLATSRTGTTTAFCKAINHDRGVLRALIVGGAEQSRVFEDIYKSHGAPPYDERVAEAKIAAHRLRDLNCLAFKREVEKASRP